MRAGQFLSLTRAQDGDSQGGIATSTPVGAAASSNTSRLPECYTENIMKKEGRSLGDLRRCISEALSDESDRSCVILVTSWADHFLQIKLAQEFAEGNSDARASLFSSNGAFATFSAKLDVAFCAGWIDRDVHHDLHLLRRMRNELAHSIRSLALHDGPFGAMIEKLQVPKRHYQDWGQLRAAATDTGLVVFTGTPPHEVKEDLDINTISFRMGMHVLISVLVANLGIPVDVDGTGETVIFELLEHMGEPRDS